MTPVPLVPAMLAGLTLTLSAPETDLLMGEPVKLVIAWSATSFVSGIHVEDPKFAYGTLEFVVDDGTGPRRYTEHIRNDLDDYGARESFTPERQWVLNYVLLEGQYQEPGGPDGTETPIFPGPGTYSLRAAYIDRRDRSIVAASNAVTFKVAAPTAEESTVHELLQRDTQLAKGWVPLPRMREVLQTYPNSRYLRRLKSHYYERVGHALRNNKHPETGESWWRLGKEEAAARARAYAEQIVQEVLHDSSWGPFEEERLWLLARAARSAHDPTLSAWAREQIKQRFPGSMAADSVEEWERVVREAAIIDAETEDTPPPTPDTTPPSLTVSASPRTLPVSYRMVPITVTVTVSDDRDPQPKVKLDSVACEDLPGRDCTTHPNVDGAEYGTDDREFELLAAPALSRQTRVYTIVYSATDAAGNRATATTTVTVPRPPPK